ncbi:MAG TPA: potassium channel family protein [Candidatus Angelobacter sp.]|nr:potassium channel family protein [Candidatus Angelobacter sp.]
MNDRESERRRTRAERYRLVAEIEAILDGPTTFLAVVFAVILAVELILQAQGSEVPAVLGWLQLGIWGVFIVHFLLGITISPDRLRYLRRNWLTAISLVIPFLRAFRALRAVRALRALNSVRVAAGFNRLARSLRGVLAWTRAGYAAALAATAALLGSAALLMFETEAPDSQITDYGEALWWAAATLTTVGAASEPVTIGGRIVALILMFGGLVLLGYVAGVVAAVLFGPPRDPRRPRPAADR